MNDPGMIMQNKNDARLIEILDIISSISSKVVAWTHLDEINEKLENFASTTAHDLMPP